MSKSWWQGRPLRIYHPNTREAEMGDLDVKRFVEDSLAINAEAVVFSSGGIFAFYPSEVPYHYVSPVIGDRDLLQEFVQEARARGLKVIARVDFSKAREDVFAEHPEWFVCDAEGQAHVRPKSNLRSTCPVAAYQNEAFAHKVLNEISERHGVDGFHLNAGGFQSFYCHCEACRTSFGDLIPEEPKKDPEKWYRFLKWRAEAFARQMAGYYRVIREHNAEAFFMEELPGPERISWGGHGAFHLPAVKDSFSQLLRTTGGMRAARSSRWWPALTADQVRALQKTPIVNIKFNMRDLNLTQAIMPPAEFTFNAFQAIAHGAGLKLCTFSLPENLLDRRPLSAIAQVFDVMRRQREVLDSAELLTDTALVWPERALIKNFARESSNLGSLRDELVGLYNAMKSQHLLFSVLYDEQLAEETLKGFRCVVLPTAVWLEENEVEAIVEYVRQGGRLVLLDGPAAFPDVEVEPMPKVLSELSGIQFSNEINRVNYALFEDISGAGGPRPEILRDLGAIALTQPYRRIEAGSEAQVWMRGVQSDDPASPENLGMLEATGDPMLVQVDVGEGLILYFAGGLGKMFADVGHGDYATLLRAMIRAGVETTPALLTDAPSCVDVTLARWSRGVAVHLVNGAGPAPLDVTAALGPIDLDLEWKGGAKVTLRTPENKTQKLAFKSRDDRIIVSVPALSAYALVVVETD